MNTIKIYDPSDKYLGSVMYEPGAVAKGDMVIATDGGRGLVGKVTRAGRRFVTLERLAGGDTVRVPAVEVYGRVVEVIRAEDEARGVEPTGLGDVRPGDVDARVEALRARLANLDGPEDESARFHLLREIYDLEHPKADLSEEWPEYIDDMRAA